MHGHITSLAVARTHRKLGLATRLMTAAREHKLPFVLMLPLLLYRLQLFQRAFHMGVCQDGSAGA